MLALLVAVLAALLLYNVCVTLRYWSARDVLHVWALPFIGNFAPVLLRRATLLEWVRSLSRSFASVGYCGAFIWSKPILLVWDPELAKQVLIKDCDSFHDPVNDRHSTHLFNLEDECRHRLRNKLSLTYISSKLKPMLPLMTKVCERLSDELHGAKQSSGATEVNLVEQMTWYAAELIGTCASGIECNSLPKKDDPDLCTMKWTPARITLKMIHTQLCRLIPWRWMFFLAPMRTLVEHRETNRIDWEDLERDEPHPENQIDYNNNLMSYMFFVAGLDGISNTLAFCMHKLAFDLDLQRRAMQAVRAAKLKHGGELSYEALQDMDLVDRILLEGLRLWTPIGNLIRECTGTTKLRNLVVQKGQMVVLCSELMHMDPTLFPEPTRFDPDRFLDSRYPYAFLPFGQDPRKSFAECFAMLEMKLAMVTVLSQFQILPSSKTGKMHQGVIKPMPKDGIWVQLKPLQPELTKEDIIKFADIEYDWRVGYSGNVIFDVVQTDELSRNCTGKLFERAKQNMPLVYVVDLGSSDWATLVIVYRDKQYFAYYVNPRGEKVNYAIKAHLQKENIHCPDIEVKQTYFDTGIFALINIKVILGGKLDTKKVIFEKSFSDGINQALKEIRKPPKTVLNLNTEIGNNKYVSVSDITSLSNQLDEHKPTDGQTTFIIHSANTPPATLTVGFRDEQVVACFVASDRTYENYITSLLTRKKIVLIFDKYNIGALDSENNIQQLILQSAKVVTNYFSKNHDYISLVKKKLKDVGSGEEITGVLSRINARKKIENKIVRCKSVIDKYMKRYGSQLNETGDFTLEQSNMLILFLESCALEDMELSRSLGEKLKRIRARIIGEEDFKVIDIIRSQYLLHRSCKNKNSIIRCKDIKRFVRDGVSRFGFFEGLQTYLNQIIDKLYIDESHSNCKVDSFFKTADDIVNISFTCEAETYIREYLSKAFTKLGTTNSYSSSDRQHIMFELTVNIIPLLEGLCSDEKQSKHNRIEIDELRNIQKEKNELIHNFHKYDSELARKFELKKFVHTTRSTFFKYVYSQKVYKLFNGSTSLLLSDDIEQKLKNLLMEVSKVFNYVPDKFADQSGAITFHSIASNLEPSTSKKPLRDFISNYVNLMHFIDNELVKEERKKKYPSLPQRYDPLTDNYNKRLYLYERFNIPKELYQKKSLDSKYKLLEGQFQRELRNKCGILKTSFDTIVNRYVKGSNSLYRNEFIERIYQDIDAVSVIKGEGRNLKISDIINSYCKREWFRAKSGSIQAKFKSISKGEIVNINGVYVSTDRFVVDILKLFDSIASQRNAFNDVEEALNDKTFLSLLEHNMNS